MKKRIAILVLGVLLLLSVSVSVLATPQDGMYVIDKNGNVSYIPETQPSIPTVWEKMIEPSFKGCRLVDGANLLDAANQTVLLQQLNEISQRQRVDIVVVTVNSLGGRSAMEYADDFYDQNGYGFGPNYDGILLLVSMEQRDWWISTTGYGITAFTDAGLEYVSEQVVPILSRGQYAKAFRIFAETCDQFVTQARTGEPYDVDNMPKTHFRLGLSLAVSVIAGLFTAGCVLWYLKGQLITVHGQSGAGSYACSLKPDLTVNKEIYLHSTMSSYPKPKFEDNSYGRSGGFGGGSITHRSSSGRFHGGRGGKF